MFKISFFVIDQDLGEVLKRVHGMALNLDHDYVSAVDSTPVESRPNGRGQAALDAITHAIRKKYTSAVLGTEVRAIVEEVGLNPASYGYYLQSLVTEGTLKKGKMVGNARQYIVTEKRA